MNQPILRVTQEFIPASPEVTGMAPSQLFGLWYHPLYTDGIHPEARFPRDRYQLLLDRFQASEANQAMDITQPQPIAKALLMLAPVSYTHLTLPTKA